ncbi:MAG: hypothetical protein H7X85_03330 [Thermoanaerobaculia bacterium]|nr:hypothetical protein [Thermoanaerobaculia bacterium]
MTDAADPEGVVRRIRRRAIALGAVASVGAFFFGWRAGLSLTICAAVVIFSFLVFEKLTERLIRPSAKRGLRKALPLLLVTVAGLVVLGIVFPWKAFDPVAGLVGLSVVVLAIGAEVFQKPGEG